jgi:hypothetical protein
MEYACKVCHKNDGTIQNANEFKLHLLNHSKLELDLAGYDI